MFRLFLLLSGVSELKILRGKNNCKLPLQPFFPHIILRFNVSGDGRNIRLVLNSHINGVMIDGMFLYFMVETNGEPSLNCMNISTLRNDVSKFNLNWSVQGGAEVSLFLMFSNRKHVHAIILWGSMYKRLGKTYSVPVKKVDRPILCFVNRASLYNLVNRANFVHNFC